MLLAGAAYLALPSSPIGEWQGQLNLSSSILSFLRKIVIPAQAGIHFFVGRGFPRQFTIPLKKFAFS
jgi:hypothetical protein